MQQTVTLSLDFVLEHFQPPSVLKIDAEAAEVHVLQGATKLLRSARPLIWCEVASDNSIAVAELLHQAGYEIYAARYLPPSAPRCRALRGTLWPCRDRESC